MAYSQRDLIRIYADNVRNGRADADLTPRQRRLTATILATASNDYQSDVAYPQSPEARDVVIRRTHDLHWSANVATLMADLGEGIRTDFDVAIHRATVILRNV